MAISWTDPDGTFRMYGGLSDAALHLTLANKRMISRQLVYRWWTKRAANGFPGYQEVSLPGGAVSELFDLIQVASWYHSYVPSKGGRPPGRRGERNTSNVA
jgi:hypothetical protein